MGTKVIMEFSSGEEMPVDTRDIAAVQKAAKEQGGWARVRVRTGMMGQVTPKQVMQSWLDNAGTAGGIVGSTVAGTVGAFLGGPVGAAAGRTLGSSAGGYLGQQSKEAGYSSMGLGDAPGTPGGEAVVQGAFGLGGEALSGVAGLGGRALIRTGLPAKTADAGRAIGEMVRERIPIGGIKALDKVPVLGRGSVKATKNFSAKLATRNAVNAAAGAQGVTIPRSVAEDAITALGNKVSAEMGDTAELRFMQRKLNEWRSRKLADLPPSEVQPIITRFDARSKPVFAAVARGENVPGAGMQARAAYMRDVADALREAMAQSVPGLSETNAKLASSIAAKNAVKKAEAGGLRSLGSRFATGAALTAAGERLAGKEPNHRMGMDSILGGAFLASPALLSRSGLALTDPYVQALLRQTPRFVLDKATQ